MRKIVLLALLVLVGCGQNPQGDVSAPTSPAPTAAPTSPAPAPTVAPAPTSPAPALDAASRPIVDLAYKDLATYLNVDAAQIKAVNVEEVEWPNGSLGCPKPGMMYPQVITPGYKITLEAQGKQYSYHTNKRAQIVRCEP